MTTLPSIRRVITLLAVVFATIGCGSTGIRIPQATAAQEYKATCDERHDRCLKFHSDSDAQYCEDLRDRCYMDIPGAKRS